LKRNEIDVLLARQAVNVVQLGRTYGLSRDALRAHRQNHLPGFLPAFTAQADGLTLDVLTAESSRLYMAALDALATAEAGTLQRVVLEDEETGERYVEHHRKVSITAVARSIREARSQLDQLVRLSATHRDEKGAPIAHDAELGAAIRAQLEAVVARRAADTADRHDALALNAPDEVAEAELVEELPPGDDGARHRHPGTQAGQHGGSCPPPLLPRDAVASLENPQGGAGNPTDLTVDEDGNADLSIAQVAAAARAAGVTPESLMSFLRQKTIPKVQHPEWQGNPAASKEERAAAGFADIPVADHRLDTPDTP
jgi:hypothetical protein